MKYNQISALINDISVDPPADPADAIRWMFFRRLGYRTGERVPGPEWARELFTCQAPGTYGDLVWVYMNGSPVRGLVVTSSEWQYSWWHYAGEAKRLRDKEQKIVRRFVGTMRRNAL